MEMVRLLIGWFIAWTTRLLLRLRYRVKFTGLKRVKKRGKGGFLFLPNHPALSDPAVLVSRLWPRYRVRPLMIEYMYYVPGLHWMSKNIAGVIPVPGFDKSSNTYKVMRSQDAAEKIKEGLRKGKNYIVYPAGKLKRTPEERVDGASLAHELLRDVPEANAVLVRTTGLWGSRLGWGLTGSSPEIGKLGGYFKRLLLKNFFLFVPRRKVRVEFEMAPDELYQQKEKVTFNRWLENWYNKLDVPLQNVGEPTRLVSYSRWKPEFPMVTYAGPAHSHDADIEHVPMDVRRQVVKELVRLSNRKPSDIRPEMHLLTDLGLDSLDLADFYTSIEQLHGTLGQMRSANVLTVAAAMQMAAGLLEVKQEEIFAEPVKGWRDTSQRPPPCELKGTTLFGVLLNTCDEMGDAIACADDRVGVVTYRQIKLKAIALSREIARMPGKRIGILLPSCVAVHVVLLACWLAGKTPTMLNWTIGPRYLEAVKEQAGVEQVISSWSFLDRLDGVDLTPIHEMIVSLEAMRTHVTLKDKLWAKKLSKKPAHEVIQELGLASVSGGDNAVILFTSGTEALPKGVPLTHENLLSNQRAALETIKVYPNDVFYGVLPPFHSLGFSISGIVPLLLGGKVIYSPDPTDAAQMVRDIVRYRPTIICSAPSFLMSLLSVARGKQLKSLRLYITGAEKAPHQLFEGVHATSETAEIIEGYGITECSPALTINRPGEPTKGVGRPLDNVELLIVHPETKQPLPTGEVGLILAKGPNVFSGYLGKEHSPFEMVGGVQWYNSGDLGSIDAGGYLTIAGRLKRFVKVGGEMISLPAIEEALQDEHATLAVIAVEIPGGRPDLILFSDNYFEVDEVNETLRAAGFSNLTRITSCRHIPEMPLMGSGKIHYRRLQEMSEVSKS